MSEFKFPGAPRGYEMSKEKPSIEVTARKIYYPRVPKLKTVRPSKSARALKSPPMEVKVVGFSGAARRLTKNRRGLSSR